MPSKLPNWCDEKGFIVKLKAHDPDTWQIFYDQYSQNLREDILKSLNKRGLSPLHVDDIENQTWRTCMEKIHEFEKVDTPCKVKRWARVIAYNHVRSLTKKLHRDDKRMVEEGKSFEEIEDIIFTTTIDESPENIIISDERTYERNEICKLIKQALGELPERDREILMRWANGGRPRELAHDYQIEPNSISKIIHRSKLKIKGYVERNNGKNQRGPADA